MKKTILVIDACVRQEESRTRRLLTTALDTMKMQHPDWKFEVLDLNKMDLKYWTTDTLKARDELLMKGDYTAPVFQYGNQFREADGIVVAAPFWDLSIPAVQNALKASYVIIVSPPFPGSFRPPCLWLLQVRYTIIMMLRQYFPYNDADKFQDLPKLPA